MTATPRRRRGFADGARLTAYDVLLAVDVEGAYSNLLLPRLLRERGLSGADAALATELTYGALRRQGGLDVVVAAAADRDPARLDPPVRALLRLGAYQLLHTRVPPHAAVSTTVELCRAVVGPRPTGLVNAVLRRVTAHPWTTWVERLAPADPIPRLAFERGYPEWIARAIADALGDDAAELDQALTDAAPTVHLVARPGRIDRAELLAAAGPSATAGNWSPYAVRLAGGNPADLAAVRDGRAAVQDEGSQLVALAATTAPIDGDDRRWLDACAGPGGKTAILAGLLPDGGRLLAADLHPHRARLVRDSAATSDVVTVVADSTRPAWPADRFDRVLLDAPCSGLGALRRRPEARWRRQPSDLPRLHGLQVELLTAAIAATRVGGIVCYATCSPHLDETKRVVAEVTGQRSDVAPVDALTLLPGVPALGAGPHVQLWPHRHGTDAMFIAPLRRTH
ncbi:MAG TPA: transcription antitermination factor NusB [Mycobacteriales bacterium]|nr:transcription antitermination factor NusB [Mycobacteriales bacterium]